MSIQAIGIDGEVSAKIIFVSPLLDRETRNARVIASLPNPDHRWKPGTFVTAEIPLGDEGSKVIVPRKSLQTIKGKPTLFVRNGDGFEAREVRAPAARMMTTSRSSSGVAPGEIYAAANTFVLKAELEKAEASEGEHNMIEHIIDFSIRHRWVVVRSSPSRPAFGCLCADNGCRSTPCRTSPTTRCRSTPSRRRSRRSSREAGHVPGRDRAGRHPRPQSTRSLSRNGFSQVTAVFDDDVDIYFARQQVSERLAEAQASLPPGVEPRMGPISTGLGEVYMWTVEYEHPRRQGRRGRDGKPGWQRDGALPHAGRRSACATDVERRAYLRTVQDWIIRPQLKSVKGVAGVDAIGGYVKQYHVQPDPMKLVALRPDLRRRDRGAGDATTSAAAPATSSTTARATSSAPAGGIETHGRDRRRRRRHARRRADPRARRRRRSAIGRELRTGSASENGEEVVVGTALMLIGANSRTVAAAVDAKHATTISKTPAAGHRGQDRARTARSWSTRRSRPSRKNLAEGAMLVIVVLFLLLGNFRAALITALVIPLSMLMTAIGHGAGQDQRQPDEPGRDRLRPDRRRRGHHRRELPAPAGRAAARARPPADARRAAGTTVRAAAEEMIQPTRLRPGDHHHRLRAAPHASPASRARCSSRWR